MEGEERFIKGLINKMLRVQISDGRVLVGSLLCTDRDQNLIMGGAAEYWHDETGGWTIFLPFVSNFNSVFVTFVRNQVDIVF